MQIMGELAKEDIVTTRRTVTRRILWSGEGRWIGRPEQVGAAFCGNEEDGRVHGEEARRR